MARRVIGKFETTRLWFIFLCFLGWTLTIEIAETWKYIIRALGSLFHYNEASFHNEEKTIRVAEYDGDRSSGGGIIVDQKYIKEPDFLSFPSYSTSHFLFIYHIYNNNPERGDFLEHLDLDYLRLRLKPPLTSKNNLNKKKHIVK